MLTSVTSSILQVLFHCLFRLCDVHNAENECHHRLFGWKGAGGWGWGMGHSMPQTWIISPCTVSPKTGNGCDSWNWRHHYYFTSPTLRGYFNSLRGYCFHFSLERQWHLLHKSGGIVLFMLPWCCLSYLSGLQAVMMKREQLPLWQWLKHGCGHLPRKARTGFMKECWCGIQQFSSLCWRDHFTHPPRKMDVHVSFSISCSSIFTFSLWYAPCRGLAISPIIKYTQ